ncbi:MAG: alanine--glyoxylate aminotransferase family protein [Gemmatimonadota bacterium]|nr:alanine--glyoxylate aminotransferase family protein [Gemmatimonadota bacterium]MDH3421382.1 alanine--glyoxylate aminotransferase family protein [Gemmatimonadota bacterium]
MSQSTSAPAGLPRGRFFLPGPTEVHPDVLQAQTRPMISHRGAGINALMKELQEGLEVAFCTKRPVFIGTNSATGFMEAGVRNAGRTRILSLVNGAFSKRFADIALSCGFEVDVIEVPWGEAHDPDQVADKLGKGSYDAVTMAHSETSTSVLNDVRALAAAAAPFEDTLVLVDSVSGFGGAELRPDAWGLDWLLTGSQKSFALPPGLAFGVASEKMMERAAVAPQRGYYFDLMQYAAGHEKAQSPSTPALSVMFSLQVQLKRMQAETMEKRWARHTAMAERTWAWVEANEAAGLSLLAPEGYRSPCVTAITVADGESGPKIVKGMAEKGWVIGGGYGKLKPSSFRIGHMGDHTLDELNELLDVLTEVVS